MCLAGFPTGHADAAGYRLEFMAGFLSLCLGVLLVPLTWQLARRLRLGDTVAALAALLVAVSPFGVWYSQEVRMYTLGACLAVVCLLATVPFLLGGASRRKLVRASILFALAAAAGLYTLYYFAFLLVSVNLLVLLVLATRWRKGRLAQSALSTGANTSRLGASLSENSKTELGLWLAAQVGAVILYLPWLPVAWRQATNPPVPPWRTAPQLGQVLVESWNALSFGQSADVTRFWPLLLLTLALVAVGVIVSWRKNGQQRLAAVFLLVATFGPLAADLASFGGDAALSRAVPVHALAALQHPAGAWNDGARPLAASGRPMAGGRRCSGAAGRLRALAARLLDRPGLRRRRPALGHARAGAALASWRRHPGQRRIHLSCVAHLLARPGGLARQAK